MSPDPGDDMRVSVTVNVTKTKCVFTISSIELELATACTGTIDGLFAPYDHKFEYVHILVTRTRVVTHANRLILLYNPKIYLSGQGKVQIQANLVSLWTRLHQL